MLKFFIKGADKFAEYAEELRLRILVGARLGVRDAIVGLDKAIMAAAMPHLKNTPGEQPHDLLQNIIQRAMHVKETDEAIVGYIRPRNAGLQPHYWLEYGITHPAVAGKLMAFDGGEIFSRSNKAFAVPPSPIFYPTAEAYQQAMVQIIEASIEKAVTA